MALITMLLFTTLFLFLTNLSLTTSQTQNLETFYPYPLHTDPPLPPPAAPPPPTPVPLLPPHHFPSPAATIARAVAATAAGSAAAAGLLFLLVRRCTKTARPQKAGLQISSVRRSNSSRYDGVVDGLIVDEKGLDVLYWKKVRIMEGKPLPSNGRSNSFRKVPEQSRNPPKAEVQEESQKVVALLGGQASSPSGRFENKAPSPPPPPLPLPPPPPPKAAALAKPPPLMSRKAAKRDSKAGGSSLAVDGPKMKPLHWEKVEVNADHSMVWDKIEGGSFRVDGELVEALFGSVAADRKPPRETRNPNLNPETSGKIFVLDARRSHNISIILRSLGTTQGEILEALGDCGGRGLTAETLEKLDRIKLTKEEQTQIGEFEGDPLKLADAESFLYRLLWEFPSAFTRFSAMLFRLNYDSEIAQLSESIETLKLACEELRTRGVFVKLLEAVLKAGNRMNAGTNRGNATAFDLRSLRKLSDVKSSDGKTTLLHFVVEEVVRSEGKRCVLNRSRSMNRTEPPMKDEREKEYLMLGLPAVGCLGVEFTNVKKAAAIDYSAFSASGSVLMNRVSEIRELVLKCHEDRDGFQVEMEEFLEMAEEEIGSMQTEQVGVMETVRNTTEYYQPGGSRENRADPLQIFVVVRDFLGMVDKACVEIARNLQRSKRAGATTEFSSGKPDFLLHKSSESGSSSSSGSDTDY